MGEHDGFIGRVLTKVTYMGLFMNVMVPGAILVVIVLFFNAKISDEGGLHLRGNPAVELVFYIFAIMIVLDFVAAYFVRNRLPAAMLESTAGSLEERFERSAVKISLIVYSLNLSYVLYGVVMIILGASVEVLMLFSVFSMIGYQLLRPRRNNLEMLMEKISSPNRQLHRE